LVPAREDGWPPLEIATARSAAGVRRAGGRGDRVGRSSGVAGPRSTLRHDPMRAEAARQDRGGRVATSHSRTSECVVAVLAASNGGITRSAMMKSCRCVPAENARAGFRRSCCRATMARLDRQVVARPAGRRVQDWPSASCFAVSWKLLRSRLSLAWAARNRQVQ